MLATYVINLDRCPERLDVICCQLDRLGMTFERISAVDGLALPADLVPYFAHARHNKLPIIEPGAVGCYASHLRVYQRIVADGLEHALVLEDDAVLPDSFLDTLQSVLAALPTGWDFVQLGRPPRHAMRPLARVVGGELVRYSRVPSGALSYLISRSGAQKLLNSAIPRVWSIDIDTRRPWLFGLEIYGVVPNPIRHGCFPTTIRTAGKRWRRGLPRPTPYTWTNLPLHSPFGMFWNMRRLGPARWARCAVVNGVARVKSALGKLGSRQIVNARPGDAQGGR